MSANSHPRPGSQDWMASALTAKAITPEEAERYKHRSGATKRSLRNLIDAEGFPFVEAERVLALKRTHDLSNKIAKLVVRGSIPIEKAVTKSQRKARRAEKRNKPSPPLNPRLAPWREIVSDLRADRRASDEPGDIYRHGRRLPGSFGTQQ